MTDDVVDEPTIRDVLINLGGNGGHPKTSVDTGIFLRLDILSDESMSTLSTQRAIGKRFLSTDVVNLGNFRQCR